MKYIKKKYCPECLSTDLIRIREGFYCCRNCDAEFDIEDSFGYIKYEKQKRDKRIKKTGKRSR